MYGRKLLEVIMGSKPKEIVIVSGKGGTGKTTLAINLSSIVSDKLIMDCDVDAPNMHIVLKPKIVKEEKFFGGYRYEIDEDLCTGCGKCFELCNFDAILKKGEKFFIKESSCDYCGVCHYFCEFDAINKEERLSGYFYISETRFGDFLHAKLIPGEENSGRLVSKIRSIARENFVDKKYFLIDGPPGIGCSVISSITGTDLVIIVVEPTKSSIHDLERIWKLTRHFNIKSTVVINRFDVNLELTNEIKKFCDKNNILVPGTIPFSKDVKNSLDELKTLDEYGSPLVKRYEEIWYNVSSLLK